jgi:rare lipoprotein A
VRHALQGTRLRAALLVCAVAFAIVLAGCGKKKTRVAAPSRRGAAVPSVAAAPPIGTTERGRASWYGHPYHGRRAADGEIYDMETMVAAHRTLPFQTWVRVRNLNSNQTVDVRIIDRGPFVDGRIIDLSHAAAIKVGLIGPGVAPVEVTVIKAPEAPEPALFAVQVGAFKDEANAERAERSMLTAYGSAKAVFRDGNPPIWRVLAGRETSPEAAEALARRIREDQHEPEAFVVRLDP